VERASGRARGGPANRHPMRNDRRGGCGDGEHGDGARERRGCDGRMCEGGATSAKRRRRRAMRVRRVGRIAVFAGRIAVASIGNRSGTRSTRVLVLKLRFHTKLRVLVLWVFRLNRYE
jgi:hypothetical protein